MIKAYEDNLAAAIKAAPVFDGPSPDWGEYVQQRMRAAFKAGARAALATVVWQPGGCIDGAHKYVGAAKPLTEALAELEDEPEQEKEV